jgi:hypothetical protein
MSQEQLKTITGSPLDTYSITSQDYLENRMPRVGQLVCFEDGRRMVFCSTKVDITVGQTVATQAPVDSAVAGATPKGVRELNVTEAAIAANAWQSGVIVLGGVVYKIKSNGATGSGGAGLVKITLYDALVVALTDTQVCGIMPPRNVDVIVGTANGDIVGTAVAAVPAATGSTTMFFWVQYGGLGSIVNVADVAGTALMPAAAGVGLIATAGQPLIATVVGAVVGGIAPAMITCDGL